jgi:hypothetical protein
MKKYEGAPFKPSFGLGGAFDFGFDFGLQP